MPVPERLNPTFVSASPPAVNPLEEARKRLIVALDVPDAASAALLVDKLDRSCRWFKVGLESFTAAGPAVLEPIIKRGHSVFLDLKLHDIPNTVSGAVRSAAALGVGVRMISVHAAGGPAMLAAARAALDGLADPPDCWPLLCSPVWMLINCKRPASTILPLSRLSCWLGWAWPQGFAALSAPRGRLLPCANSQAPRASWSFPAFAPRAPKLATRSASPLPPKPCDRAPASS